jgi:hypothetical protein
MKDGLVVCLIEGWSADDRPQIKEIVMVSGQAECRPHSSRLLEQYMNTGQSACGNRHAGQGRPRVVTSEPDGDVVYDYSRDIELKEILEKALPRLGRRILISAGHYMPDKASGFLDVNQHSLTSLAEGLKRVQQLSEQGIESDLIITINDVTVTDANESPDSATAATLSWKERAQFYQRFVLPVNYVELIHEYRRRCRFNTYVVGENKLSERLLKSKGRLIQKGLLQCCEGGYAVAFDVDRILEIAHTEEDTAPRSRVFISEQRGVSGRPKCVRACALLAALPHQLGYTGFIQFLPVCARNALEGLLIGTRLFQGVPYISIHATQSCF